MTCKHGSTACMCKYCDAELVASMNTPRTDALMERLEREAKPYNYRWHDWADLARSLERELNAALTPQPEAIAPSAWMNAEGFVSTFEGGGYITPLYRHPPQEERS